LKLRHIREKPYTRTGDIVVAVNPYQWLNGLYSEEKRCYYANRLVWEQSEEDPRAVMEPHVYEVSALSYKGLAFQHEDQSILVSGESGAGKTETVKICLNHIAATQRGQIIPGYGLEGVAEQDPVVRRVVESNPLLEAFGNAKTRRNDNSSRFGKYLQLQFERDLCKKKHPGVIRSAGCGLVGSKCDVYLLEKNRVVGHDPEERTFHIFYQLLAGGGERFWDGLAGATNESFKYVGPTKTNKIEGMTDAERFQETLDALALVDVVGPFLTDLMRAICITMQLGNIGFEPDQNDSDKSRVSTPGELAKLSKLMGVDSNDLTLAFTERTFKTRTETHKVPLRADAAKDACDALAKEAYQKAFLWLVSSINRATCAEESQDKSYGTIGLLDIFGFESFCVNRFEQLCINYANEKLQQKFTEDVFKSVQEEYRSEGIPLSEIWFDDNTDVLDLIEGPTGLLNLLNEECIRPKGNDFDFVQKALLINKGAPTLLAHRTDRLSFGIHHYAGQVMYDAEGFVSRNVDTLPTDLQACSEKCDNDIISSPRTESLVQSRKTGNSRVGHEKIQSNITAPTIWSKYKSQLTSLMASLRKTKSRYIRCIKPNSQKAPYIMDHESTVDQLRCAGVVAGITISRACFPNRLPNSLVLGRYSSFANPKTFPSRNKASSLTIEQKNAEDCKVLLAAALQGREAEDSNGNLVRAYVVGKTKTFFRAGALEFLESGRMSGLDSQAAIIQSAARGWLVRNKGRRNNQRRKMEEAARLQAERDRQAQLQQEKEERTAQYLRDQQKYIDECNALEAALRQADREAAETVEKAERCKFQVKHELEELDEKCRAQEEEIRARNIEKALQEKRLEEAKKLIIFLRKENKKALKQRDRARDKCDNEASNNGLLEESNCDLSEGVDVAEEMTIKEKTHYEVLNTEYEEAKATNKLLKSQFRSKQNEYLDVANGRLELQKTLQKILTIIEKSQKKPKSLVGEINAIVRQTEGFAKAHMAALEAEFSNDDQGEYTETDNNDSHGGPLY
jgi:myosin-5